MIWDIEGDFKEKVNIGPFDKRVIYRNTSSNSDINGIYLYRYKEGGYFEIAVQTNSQGYESVVKAIRKVNWGSFATQESDKIKGIARYTTDDKSKEKIILLLKQLINVAPEVELLIPHISNNLQLKVEVQGKMTERLPINSPENIAVSSTMVEIKKFDDFITIDVLYHILSYLTPHDAQRFIFCCKVFYHALNTDSFVWNTQLRKFQTKKAHLYPNTYLIKSFFHKQRQQLFDALQKHSGIDEFLLFLVEHENAINQLVHPKIIKCWHFFAELGCFRKKASKFFDGNMKVGHVLIIEEFLKNYETDLQYSLTFSPEHDVLIRKYHTWKLSFEAIYLIKEEKISADLKPLVEIMETYLFDSDWENLDKQLELINTNFLIESIIKKSAEYLAPYFQLLGEPDTLDETHYAKMVSVAEGNGWDFTREAFLANQRFYPILKNINKDNCFTQIEELPFDNPLQDLDLQSTLLTRLPRKLKKLSFFLESLYLSNNNIVSLEGIGEFNQLKSLTVTGNHIVFLPVEISLCKRLKYLNVQHNSIFQIPAEIGKLHYLEDLVLLGNPIYSLPDSLCKLTSLKEIGMHSVTLKRLSTKFKAIQDKIPNLYLGLKFEWKDSMEEIPLENEVIPHNPIAATTYPPQIAATGVQVENVSHHVVVVGDLEQEEDTPKKSRCCIVM